MVTDDDVLTFTGTLPYGKATYSITVDSTGYFGTSNSREITITVTGGDPAYLSSRADTVDSIEITTTGAVTGTPRAADFGVMINNTAYFAPAGAPAVAGHLSLPAGKTVSSADTVKVRYARCRSTSDLRVRRADGYQQRPGGPRRRRFRSGRDGPPCPAPRRTAGTTSSSSRRPPRTGARRWTRAAGPPTPSPA